MNHLRNFNPKPFTKNKKDLRLQIVDWDSYNESPEEEEGEEKYKDNAKYIIQIFGIDEEGQSVSIKINGFKPRFFVNIPKHWEKMEIDIFINYLQDNVKKRYKDSIHDHKVLRRHKFRGFTNYEELKFIKFTFKNTYAMNQYVNILRRKLLILQLGKTKRKYDLYESNIEAFIRFIHIQNIDPAGWVQVEKTKYQIAEPARTYCQKEIEAQWKEVKAYDRKDIAPMLVASFDIECDSSHGDFPLAKKGYKKFANEVIDNIQKKWKAHELDKKKNKELFESQEKKTEFIWKLLDLGFSPEQNLEDISFLYTKNNIKPRKRDLKEIIDKMVYIAFTRIKKISDNKELKAAVEETKKIWANQSLEVLESIAFDMGKKYEVSNEKILNRIITRDIVVDKLTGIFDNFLPTIEGDKVIQIGTTIHRYGEEECFMKHIVTLGTCNNIKGAEVVQCETEEDVIKEWFKFIRILDPDMITGYNIFGFDFSFIYHRADELGILGQLGTLGRVKGKDIVLEEKNLSSSALGENILTYLNMEGRVCMDLLKVVQKDHKLASYKLDTVAETFISGGIKEINGCHLKIDGAKDLNIGNYIVILMKNDKYKEGKKIKIMDIQGNIITLTEEIEDILAKKPTWRLAKDDIGPKDIFRLQKGDAEDRKIVATYCIQDCALCNKLINKLSIVSNNIGMANVCSVPLSYIFLRGQGVKIFSLVAKECKDKGFLIPVLKKPKQEDDKSKKKIRFNTSYGDDTESEDEDEGGYEGAIVLEPQPGIYLEDYVTVLDYSSLYPSSMISENLSHDTYVMEEKYDNLPGYEYKDITHDVYEWINPLIKSKGKRKVGQKTCRFVQFPDGRKGIIPQILQKLLKARKSTRKKIIYSTVKYSEEGEEKEFSGMYEEKNGLAIIKTVEGEIVDFPLENLISKKDTYSEFQKEVLDGLQLAYKITANSLYGQIGARTSQIYLKDIAASTTATGRNLLHLAKDKTLERFDGAEIVYGDTDSIFINFNPKDEEGNRLTGKEGLKKSIDLGVQAEEYIQQFLLPPHRLEYEKTFWPFILFTKKRYIGDKYEFDLEKCKQTSMGIVLKRRDNADIVKHVYGGIMKIIMQEKNIPKSIEFLQTELEKLVDGQFPLDMLTITKSLKSYYKNPESIAHKVLADRIGEREPGNKPLPSDRIPYVYIVKKEKKGVKMLQGDKIELPRYILEHKLKPDYLTYITNQIMKPVCQIYALIVEDLEGYKYHKSYFKDMYKRLEMEHGKDKAMEKISKKKNDLVSNILFSDVIRIAENKKNNVKEITNWFSVKA
jgi:DNA polymerase elongation subunit (family B)